MGVPFGVVGSDEPSESSAHPRHLRTLVGGMTVNDQTEGDRRTKVDMHGIKMGQGVDAALQVHHGARIPGPRKEAAPRMFSHRSIELRAFDETPRLEFTREGKGVRQAFRESVHLRAVESPVFEEDLSQLGGAGRPDALETDGAPFPKKDEVGAAGQSGAAPLGSRELGRRRLPPGPKTNAAREALSLENDQELGEGAHGEREPHRIVRLERLKALGDPPPAHSSRLHERQS